MCDTWIMRWERGKSEGQVVAGTGERGSGIDQLKNPSGVAPLTDGSFLVADSDNHGHYDKL